MSCRDVLDVVDGEVVVVGGVEVGVDPLGSADPAGRADGAFGEEVVLVAEQEMRIPRDSTLKIRVSGGLCDRPRLLRTCETLIGFRTALAVGLAKSPDRDQVHFRQCDAH